MRLRYAVLAACVLVLAVPVAASAHPMPVSTLAQTLGNATASLTQAPDDGGADFTTSDNMRLLGFSERRVAPNDFPRFNTDLAFWGDRAFQGQFNGFRILDIDNPRRPREILNYEQCGTVGQGDVVVWGSILVRSWDVNSPAGQTCDGEPVPAGFEGLHVFDISDVMNPELVASRRPDVWLAHRNRRARSRQPPAARLQHAFERRVRRPRHRRGAAQPAGGV